MHEGWSEVLVDAERHLRRVGIFAHVAMKPLAGNCLVELGQAGADLLRGVPGGPCLGLCPCNSAFWGDLAIGESGLADHLAEVLEMHRCLSVRTSVLSHPADHVLHLIVREADGGDLPEGRLKRVDLDGILLPREVAEGTLEVSNCPHPIRAEAGLVGAQEVLEGNLLVWKAVDQQLRHIHAEVTAKVQTSFFQVPAMDALLPVAVEELEGITELLVREWMDLLPARHTLQPGPGAVTVLLVAVLQGEGDEDGEVV
mmetsp:Transcript_53439/g.125374  ORF Transcript_53439/g.125374 Transcript_53439/m.125374 type:complete len:256 (-) Transcript_53439:1274-2041(-)